MPARLFTRPIITGVIIVACTLGMTTFSLASIFFALETNDELRSVFSHVTLESHRLLQMCGWSLLAAFLVTAPDFMQRVFGTKDMTIGQWLICIVVSSLILWVIEIVKIFRRQAAASSIAELETVSAAQAAA